MFKTIVIIKKDLYDVINLLSKKYFDGYTNYYTKKVFTHKVGVLSLRPDQVKELLDLVGNNPGVSIYIESCKIDISKFINCLYFDGNIKPSIVLNHLGLNPGR